MGATALVGPYPVVLSLQKGLSHQDILAELVGRERGLAGMLVEQAAEAFVWWRGVSPDTAAVIRELTVLLR